MIWFALTVFLTLSVSAFCSALEALVLSTTDIEIESLKKVSPRRGKMLEYYVRNIDETISAVLTANTIANTFGATLAGVQCAALFGSGVATKYIFPAILTRCHFVLRRNFAQKHKHTLPQADSALSRVSARLAAENNDARCAFHVFYIKGA